MRNHAAAPSPTWPVAQRTMGREMQRCRDSAPKCLSLSLKLSPHIYLPKPADALRNLQIKAGTI